uniref:Demethylmenaquinone methyltransferase n=1 Tax=Candidatus Kentrum sp. SD TaxID=2126332 RepID=A0A450YH03_9GAMM|nr:MAG: demethylmenaquinone methyltransferase [Candidatus Kentron sp. SD]VFK46401.1 MAG: demethylmenaquinone methyltransferase [Candidatus Kentron sp. SD]
MSQSLGSKRHAITDKRLLNEKSFAEAWYRWAPKQRVFLDGVTQSMLRVAQIQPGIKILDLASGPGNPALQFAEAVTPSGMVTATDISPDMVASAQRGANQLGLSNMKFRVADADALPFDTDSFDRITCRFGIMYFSDTQRALSEVMRVCKPGGRAVFVSWGPEEQPFFASTHGIVSKYMQVPLRPDAPDTFAFAQPGLLQQALDNAGFKNVNEEALTIEMLWPGSPADLWKFFQEVTASFAEMKQSLSPGNWQHVTNEVKTALSVYARDEHVCLSGMVNLALGIVPATNEK